MKHTTLYRYLHAVAEEGISLRDTAAAIGRRLGVPATPVAAGDAGRRFGFLSAFVGLDNPTSSQITRDLLGWTPARPGLLSDLDEEHNLAAEAMETLAGWRTPQRRQVASLCGAGTWRRLQLSAQGSASSPDGA